MPYYADSKRKGNGIMKTIEMYNPSNLRVRNAKAKRYSKRCRKMKIQKMVKRYVFAGIAISGTIATLLFMASHSEPRYAIASEHGTMHYEYVTERKCTVTDIQNMITVSYNGNEYAFYGDGFQKGDEVICKFTDDFRIVDAEVIE